MAKNSKENYEAQKERMMQLANQHRYLDLRKYTAELLSQDPEFAYALLLNGLSYCKMNDASGFPIMEQALAKEPENAFYFFMVSHAYATHSHKNVERSLQLIRKAIELRPYNVRYREFTGELLSQERRFKEAIPYFEQAIELDADNASAFAEIAYCHSQIGMKKEALEGIEDALRQDPGDGRINMLRSYIYYYYCDYKTSREAIQFCLNEKPDNENNQYVHLMSHHNAVSGFFFRRQVIEVMQRMIVVLGGVATLVQLTVFAGWLNQTIADVFNYVTFFFVFYLFIRGFMSALLVWRMKKAIRDSMFLGRKRNLIVLYTALMLLTISFISDLIFHCNISHAVFWILLHAVMGLTAIYFRRTFSRRDKILVAVYFLLCLAATPLLLNYDFGVFSALLLFLTTYLITPFKDYFIRVCKVNLGFDNEGEDDFSF